MFETGTSSLTTERPSGRDDWEEWEEPPRPRAEEGIPGNLDTWEPGPVLGALLSSIDPERISAADRVAVMRAAWRQISWSQAIFYRTLASLPEAYRQELEEDDEELLWEATAAEVQAALRLTRRAADRELDLAGELSGRLPKVGEALARGEIDRPRALVILSETAHLPPQTAREVVDEVLGEAGRLTTGQLGARLRRLSMQGRPQEAEERFREARGERRVVVEPTPEGTAHLLLLHLSPEEARGAASRIDGLARHLRRQGETRTMDQLRADVAADLLGGRWSARAARVEVRVDLETLLGLAERPGELSGFGPVVASVARRVARGARSWDYLVTDPRSGEVLETGPLRRRPTAAQARAVRARDPHCVFPGCRMPARDSDLDHRRPHARGGPTEVENLAPLCRYHHRLRHRAGWTYRRTPDGDYIWRSPLGRTYTTSGRPP